MDEIQAYVLGEPLFAEQCAQRPAAFQHETAPLFVEDLAGQTLQKLLTQIIHGRMSA